MVRAFDTGVLGAGILYSGRTGNTQTVTIAAQGGGGLTSGKLSDVYVYPNPYKGSHSGEQLPIVSNGQNLFVRQPLFPRVADGRIEHDTYLYVGRRLHQQDRT